MNPRFGFVGPVNKQRSAWPSRGDSALFFFAEFFSSHPDVLCTWKSVTGAIEFLTRVRQRPIECGLLDKNAEKTVDSEMSWTKLIIMCLIMPNCFSLCPYRVSTRRCFY